jgi:predicted dehydrogenase
MRTYNLGFIACGARNRVYARNLRRQYNERTNIAAICDANRGATEEFKIEFGHLSKVSMILITSRTRSSRMP